VTHCKCGCSNGDCLTTPNATCPHGCAAGGECTNFCDTAHGCTFECKRTGGRANLGECGPCVESMCASENKTCNSAKTSCVDKTYAVTVNLNGGTGTAPTISPVIHGRPIAARVPVPTRSGYTFGGYWDTQNQTGGKQYINSDGSAKTSSHVTGATTLHARWIEVPDECAACRNNHATLKPSIPGSENCRCVAKTCAEQGLQDVGGQCLAACAEPTPHRQGTACVACLNDGDCSGNNVCTNSACAAPQDTRPATTPLIAGCNCPPGYNRTWNWNTSKPECNRDNNPNYTPTNATSIGVPITSTTNCFSISSNNASVRTAWENWVNGSITTSAMNTEVCKHLCCTSFEDDGNGNNRVPQGQRGFVIVSAARTTGGSAAQNPRATNTNNRCR